MGSLAHEPGEAARLLAAAREACDAMNRLASADRRQVQALASAGRLLAATGPGPDTLDMLGPLAPAPPDRTGALLTLYEFTARATPTPPPPSPKPLPQPGYRTVSRSPR